MNKRKPDVIKKKTIDKNEWNKYIKKCAELREKVTEDLKNIDKIPEEAMHLRLDGSW